MPRYRKPTCVAFVDESQTRTCNAEIDELPARHPLYAPGPSATEHHAAFRCSRCGAVRAFDKRRLGRYLERV